VIDAYFAKASIAFGSVYIQSITSRYALTKRS